LQSQGFGTASLNQDAHELKLLVEWLVTEEGSVGVVLMGHSTGGGPVPLAVITRMYIVHDHTSGQHLS
jgi:hypothetical protein